MARKKKTESITTTYLVMVHSDGRPAEVLLPDGRMALLVPESDLYPCTRAQVFQGVVHRRKNDFITVYGEDGESIEDIKEGLIFDGHDPKSVRAMKLEHHPMVSFT